MSEQDIAREDQRLDEILSSSIDPAKMAQQIIRLGFEPEVADELVERHQLGAQAPMYYETLKPYDLTDESDDHLFDDSSN